MNKDKGFTLVEILGVIIVLGLLATLIIPNISKILQRSTDKTFLESAKSIIRSAENYLADEEYNYEEGDCYSINDNHIELKDTKTFKNGEFCVINGQPFLKHVTDGEKCISGGIDTLETYKCGEKYIAMFDASKMEYINVPYTQIPYVAFVVGKDETLANYINDYYVSVDKLDGTTYQTYDFWKDYDLNARPLIWSTAFDDSSKITSDVIYKVEDAYSTENPYESIVNEGNYLIRHAANTTFYLGLPTSYGSGTYQIQSKNPITYNLTSFGSYFIIRLKENMNYSFDTTGGTQILNATPNIYGYSTNGGTPQQRFIFHRESGNMFSIRANSNNSLCITPTNNRISQGNNYKLLSCDGSINQMFYFEKVK